MGKQKEQKEQVKEVQEQAKEQVQESKNQEVQKPKPPFIYVGPTVYEENFFLTQHSVFSEIPPYVKNTPYEELFYPFEEYRQRKQEIDKEVREKLRRIMEKKEKKKNA